MCHVYHCVIRVFSHSLKDVSGTDCVGYWQTLRIDYIITRTAVFSPIWFMMKLPQVLCLISPKKQKKNPLGQCLNTHTYRYSLTEETEADSVTVVVTGGCWACSSRRVRCTECGCGRSFLRILNAEPVPVAPRLTIGSWLPLCAAHLFAWVLSIGSFFFVIYFYLLIYFCTFAHFYCIHLCVQFSFVLVLDMYSPVVWLCGAGWFVSCDAQTNGVSFICCRLEDIGSLAFYGEPTPGHMVI